MAKMFYTLEEAAAKLGLGEEQIKEMAGSGKLQQFRDRDKLMFKRDQVDALAGGSQPDDSGTDLSLDDDLSLDAGPGASDLSDKADLNAASAAPSSANANDATDELSLEEDNSNESVDARQATGISVFDADELDDPADPMAQTQVTSAATVDEEELALESVGSGSGLLDLTRESDDTSLGAELLDEIYPAEGSKSGSRSGTASSADTFDPATLDLSDTTPTGLANLPGSGTGLEHLEQQGFDPMSSETNVTEGMTAVAMINVADPGSDVLGWLNLIPATGALILGMIVALGAVMGVTADQTTMKLAELGDKLLYICLGVAVLAVAAGIIGNVMLSKRR